MGIKAAEQEGGDRRQSPEFGYRASSCHPSTYTAQCTFPLFFSPPGTQLSHEANIKSRRRIAKQGIPVCCKMQNKIRSVGRRDHRTVDRGREGAILMSHSVCRGEKRTEAPEEEEDDDGGFSFPEYYSWRASRHKEKGREVHCAAHVRNIYLGIGESSGERGDVG